MDAPFPDDLVPAWEEFLSAPRTLDDLFAHPRLFPLQRRRELEKMIMCVEPRQITSYMEIGADKGGGLWAWIKQFERSIKKVIACEIRGTPYSALFERAFPHVRFLWLPWDSQAPAVVRQVRAFCADHGDLDVLFVDGEKRCMGFYEDWQTYAPLVRDGGTVFVHDVTDAYDQGPGPCWDRIRENLAGTGHACSEIVDRTEADEAVRRMELNVPSASAHEEWLRHWRGRSCGVGVVRV